MSLKIPPVGPAGASLSMLLLSEPLKSGGKEEEDAPGSWAAAL